MAIKVLIVDDSSFFQKRLTQIINADPRLEVVAVAADGKEAISLIQRLRPDVITLDLEMPVMGGIEAMATIKSITSAPVLMLSTWTTEGAKATLEALEAGATDFMPKRFEDLAASAGSSRSILCERIYSLVHHKQPTQTKSTTTVKRPTPSSCPIKKPELLVIGSSTGGPVALQKILTALPANFPVPILLIQHMPAAFTPSFAQNLNAKCAIEVKEATHDERPLPGKAYLAPGGKQLSLAGKPGRFQILIHEAAQTDTYKPCVDQTFATIAQACASSTLALILTGMGSDGREGCRAIKAGGGTVWCQDQQSSTIYGMPRAVAMAGLADRELSLSDIGPALVELF